MNDKECTCGGMQKLVERRKLVIEGQIKKKKFEDFYGWKYTFKCNKCGEKSVECFYLVRQIGV